MASEVLVNGEVGTNEAPGNRFGGMHTACSKH
jgi:hypothetical protein